MVSMFLVWARWTMLCNTECHLKNGGRTYPLLLRKLCLEFKWHTVAASDFWNGSHTEYFCRNLQSAIRAHKIDNISCSLLNNAHLHYRVAVSTKRLSLSAPEDSPCQYQRAYAFDSQTVGGWRLAWHQGTGALNVLLEMCLALLRRACRPFYCHKFAASHL